MRWKKNRKNVGYHIKKVTSLICDKTVTTQNLAFLIYWYRKKGMRLHF